MYSEIAINVSNLSKFYKIYENEKLRLLDLFMPSSKYKNRYFYKEFWALKNINLKIYKGESIGIIGRNGSGKSTLLKIISGILEQSSGDLLINGKIGALLELGSGFNMEFTGRENVYINGQILGASRVEIEEKFADIVKFSEIGELIDRPVKTYSSGMLAKLAFSVATSFSPSILIVDEALSVGDALFQYKCMERIAKLQESGTALILVSHDLQAIKRFCVKALYLEKGMQKKYGIVDEVIEDYFMDINAELAQHVSYIKKPSLNLGLGFSHGTNEGYITAAHFRKNKKVICDFDSNEEIILAIDYKFNAPKKDIKFSIFLHDRFMTIISGKTYSLCQDRLDSNFKEGILEVKFFPKLAPGLYYVTLRLESGSHLSGDYVCLDKHSGALSFTILHYKPDFLGIMNFDFEINNEVNP